MNDWKLTYKVTADFLPFRVWSVRAETPDEARLWLAQYLNIPFEQTEAKL